jgi:hypothetical protein
LTISAATNANKWSLNITTIKHNIIYCGRHFQEQSYFIFLNFVSSSNPPSVTLRRKGKEPVVSYLYKVQ